MDIEWVKSSILVFKGMFMYLVKFYNEKIFIIFLGL